MRTCTVAILLSLALAPTAHAGGRQANVLGMGIMPCKDVFASPYSDTTRWVVSAWASGYLSGVSTSLRAREGRVFNLAAVDVNAMFYRLADYCRANPSAPLIRGVERELGSLGIEPAE